MGDVAPLPAPLLLFLDTGVLVEGFLTPWGSAKGVLILAPLRAQIRAVVADPVREELAQVLARELGGLTLAEAAALRASVDGWFRIARPDRAPWPTAEQMQAHAGLLATVRHDNAMPGAVAAVLARPDWVLSTNTRHWNRELALRTGLRIATPRDFLASLRP